MLSPPMPPPHLTALPPLPIDPPLNNNMSDSNTSPSLKSAAEDLDGLSLGERGSFRAAGLQGFNATVAAESTTSTGTAEVPGETTAKQEPPSALIAVKKWGLPKPQKGWRDTATEDSGNPDGDDEEKFLAFCAGTLGFTQDVFENTFFNTSQNDYSDDSNNPDDPDDTDTDTDTDTRKRTLKIQVWTSTLDQIDGRNKKERRDAKSEWRDQLISKQRYFHPLFDVVKAELVALKDFDHFNANLFQRDGVPNWDEYTKNKVRRKPGEEDTGTRAFSKKTLVTTPGDTITPQEKDKIWPCDVLGRHWETADADVAHMIPNSRDHANEWADVACWAFGMDPKETTNGVALRLLHGVKRIKKNGEDGLYREDGSGLRHFKANRLRIDHQSNLIDKKEPSLLIIPIMDVNDCKGWNGGEYEAILLVKEGKLASLGLTDTLSAKNIRDAKLDEVAKAINLLRQCTIAMAKSLDDKSIFASGNEDPEHPEEKLRRTRQTCREKLVESLIQTKGEKSIVLPYPNRPYLDLKYKGVCKIKFSDCRDDPVATQNPAPDPLLLVARASVAWSIMHGIHLRTAAEPRPDDESDASDDSGALTLLPSDYPLPSPLKEQWDSIPESITVRTEDDSLVSALEPNCDNHDDDISSISSLSFTG